MDIILSKRIQLLPKEIRDLIYMFNVEHRHKMKKVFNYIHGIIYKCWVCDIYLIDILHHHATYMRRNILVCSKECEIFAEEELFGVP
jgi:hypothetical protein